MVNRVHGKGTENVNMYRNCILTHLDIDNIHKARSAHKKMGELFLNKTKDSKWFQAIHDSNWPTFIQRILKGAKLMAKAIVDGYPVLVHCSDGWDRTAQLSSLC